MGEKSVDCQRYPKFTPRRPGDRDPHRPRQKSAIFRVFADSVVCTDVPQNAVAELASCINEGLYLA